MINHYENNSRRPEDKLFSITGIKTNIMISNKLLKNIIIIEDKKLINFIYTFLQETLDLTIKINLDEAFNILGVIEL